MPETVFILALKNLTIQEAPSALGKPSPTKLPSSSASFGFSETATPFLLKDLTLALPLGMYFLLDIHAAAAAAKSLQLCPTLCDPIDGSPSGSIVPGILQARTLERVAISFSNA